METLLSLWKVFIAVIIGIFGSFRSVNKKTRDLRGKTMVITGGGSGIGRLLAIRFARLGCQVIILDVNEASMIEAKTEIELIGGFCIFYKCDVANRHMVSRTAAKILSEVGEVHFLVNNAGVINGKRFLKLEEERILTTMNINLMSHFWMTKAFLPGMIKRNSGQIVAISSVAGLTGGCNMSDYCASKFGIIGFMESLKYELIADGVTGVHTTIVCPWYISTGLFSGVDPGTIGFLLPDYVADKVEDAILGKHEFLMIPRVLYFIYFLKSFLPLAAIVEIFKALNGPRQMDSFVGRNPPSRESSPPLTAQKGQ